MLSSVYSRFFNSEENKKLPPYAEKKDIHFELEIIPYLPKAICQFILIPYLDLETKTEFALDSQYSKIPEFKKTLWECIARGEQVLAEKLLIAHPEWLWERATIVDLSQRTIVDATPFQLAYGGQDVEMCQMMLPFAKGREGDILEQIHERFPSLTEEEKPYDFSHIIDAIASNNNDQIDRAFEKFKEDFRPRKIEKGWHFNVKNLVLAAQLQCENLEIWSTDQRSLFLKKCVGYLQYQLPASYAQAYCHGLLNLIQHKNEPLKRSLILDDKTSFYDTEFIDKYYIISNHPLIKNIFSAKRYEDDDTFDHSVYIDDLCSLKKNGMEKFIQQLQDLQPRCIIC